MGPVDREEPMTVARIISEKGRNVITVAQKDSLADIATMLAEKRIGAVVVMEKDAIRGIVSERDIVRAVAKHGGQGLAMSAAEWMTANVVTCRPEDTINDVMQKMTSGRFRHLPVIEGGRLGGIVSIGDIVKRRIEDVEREAAEIRDYIAHA